MSEFKNHELLMQKWNESNINPLNSLFPIHTIDYFDKKTIFMIMDNILSEKNNNLSPLFFDIKGNPGNRKIKDDFLFISVGLSLEFSDISLIYKQFLKNTQWLSRNGIMDYSMTIAAPFESLLLVSDNLEDLPSTDLYIHVHKLIHKKPSSMKVSNNSISTEPWTHKDLSLCIDLNYPSPFLDVNMKQELRKRHKSQKYTVTELKEFYKSIPKFIPVLDMSYQNQDNIYCRSKFHIIDPSQQFVMIKKLQKNKKKNKKCSKCHQKSILLNYCSVCGDSSCDPEAYRKRFIHFFESITCKNSQLIHCPKLCETKMKKSKKKTKKKRKKKKSKKKKPFSFF